MNRNKPIETGRVPVFLRPDYAAKIASIINFHKLTALDLTAAA